VFLGHKIIVKLESELWIRFRVYDVYSIKNKKVFWAHKIIICLKNGLCVKGLSLRFIMFTLLKRHFGS